MDDIKLKKIIEFNNNIKPYISYIGGFHLWGKRKSKTGRWTSHTGDLNAFCNQFIPDKDSLFENELAIAYFDEFPVSKGHVLIITKRHAATFFDITDEERMAILDLLNKCKKYIDKKYNPDGYNVGLNCGKDAGQSVMHVHMHLIPRYKGDVENPRGGIRGVIPNKKNY